MYISLALRGICLTAVVISGALFFQISDQKQELAHNLNHSRSALQEKISETASLKSRALEADEQRLAQIEIANEAIVARNEYKAQYDTLIAKVEEAKAERIEAENKISEINATNRDLQRQIYELKASFPPQNWREEQNQLQSRLLQLEAENTSLRNTFESANIKAGGQYKIPTPSIAQVTRLPVGEVMRIGPDGSFAILSYGRKLGAAEGQTLTIRRDQRTVALVSLTQITNDFSIAQIVSSTNTGVSLSVPDIQVGDTAHLE